MNDYSKYSDKELIILFHGDKPESDYAFRAIYNKYASRIYAYCLRVLGNQQLAEDIFQETFIKFYEKVISNHKTGTISGFLITIVRNLCLNHKRDTRSNILIEEYHSILKEQYSENKEEIYKILTASLELLPFEFREPLVLRMYDGLSYKEIAEICEISIDNARKRVFRAKLKIKEILEPYYKEI